MSNRVRPARFLVTFAVLSLVGLLVVRGSPAPMSALKEFIAELVSRTMTILGSPAATHGTVVTFGPHPWIQIVDECTGIYATVLLGAFILAFPCPWRRRVTALVIALTFVGIVNVIRISLLGIFVHRAPELAGFVHDYLWQVVWGTMLIGFAFEHARRGLRALDDEKAVTS